MARLLFPLLLIGLPVQAAVAADPDWKAKEAAFWSGWKVDKKATKAVRSKYRARKRKAADALRDVPDARAINALCKGLKRQQGLIDVLLAEWSERRESWKKLEEPMRRSLNEKVKRFGTPNPPVTPGEQKWLKEERLIEVLYEEVNQEREIAAHTRTVMARVLEQLQGKERAKALKEVVTGIGKGETPAQRDFVRVLGETPGDDVTRALLLLAGQSRASLTQVALEALGRQNAPGNVELLVGFLKDERWQVRAAAIGGLGYFKRVQVVELLIDLAQKEPGVLQRHCFTALSQILGEAVPGGVDAWKVWWGKEKQRFAEDWEDWKGGAPIRRRSEPVMVRQGQGHTTFYGIQTNSKHVVFIIDKSGSMKEADGASKGARRLDVAKEELKRAIKSLHAEHGDERGEASFNVIAYDAMVTVYKTGKMVKATKKNKEDAFKWIDGLEPLGATNIFDSIETAFHIISEKKERLNALKGADTFFLMTDGQPTTGRVKSPELILEEVRKLNATRQVIIHTIGVGKQHKVDFLRTLAAENRGEYVGR